ncbi:hypothetical protein BGZ49_005427 [Haplosporangium sp. Z 27]|nr:hypothetical protein BGZ49_005427 [Haplosporangium sp. Z 27]
MATVALLSGARQFLERHLVKGNHSPTEVAVAAALGILIAAIAKYPDRAMFTVARPDLKDKAVPGVPLLGNMLGALTETGNPLETLKKSFEKNNDIFVITVPIHGRMIAINSPELIEYIHKTNFSNYIRGKEYYELVKDLLGDGLFVKDGEEWRTHRKLVVMVFTTKMYRQVTKGSLTHGARELCDVFDKYEKLGKPMDLQNLFLKQTLDVFGRLTFGIEFNTLHSEEPHEFEEAFDYLMTNFDSRLVNPFWKYTDQLIPGKVKKIKACMASMDKYAYIAIEKRRKETEEEKATRPNDFLDHFINHVDEDGNTLSDKELRDIFVDFMLAGRDTTGYTLVWQFYSLLANPRVMKNALKELEIVLQGSEEYTFENLNHDMPYLKAIFYESVRLYPPIPRNMKTAANDDVFPDGTRILKGDRIIYSPWTMSRNRNIWGEDAELFVPERWLVDDDETSAAPGHSTATAKGRGVSPFGKFRIESMYKFSSFSSGPRLCVGQTFATIQALATTCMLLQNFDIALVPRQPVPEPKPSGALPMIHPLWATAKRKPKRNSDLSTSFIHV